jgi:hypothetical protein
MTIQRRVIITKTANLRDAEALPEHPNVRKCWQLPSKHTLFEFYDPVFEIVFNLDPRIRRTGEGDSKIVSALKRAFEEERKLLAPLYKGRTIAFNGVQLAVPAKTALYLFLARTAVVWPKFASSPDFETARSIQILGQLSATSSLLVVKLEAALREWRDSMTALGQISQVHGMTVDGLAFSLPCEFAAECGDATMALYKLLADTKALASVGFFLPTDVNPRRYFPIGKI